MLWRVMMRRLWGVMGLAYTGTLLWLVVRAWRVMPGCEAAVAERMALYRDPAADIQANWAQMCANAAHFVRVAYGWHFAALVLHLSLCVHALFGMLRSWIFFGATACAVVAGAVVPAPLLLASGDSEALSLLLQGGFLTSAPLVFGLAVVSHVMFHVALLGAMENWMHHRALRAATHPHGS